MMIGAITNKSRWWDLPSILILLVILTIAFSRLVATRWAENLDVTRHIAYIGLVAGLALGYSRFTSRQALFYGMAYGVFFITGD